jgi:hypothetical protein
MSASRAACVASRAARASNSSFASVIANGKIRWPRRRTTSSAAHTLTEDGLPLINRSARTRSRGRTTGLMQLPDKPRTEASSPTDRRAGSLVFLELKRCELVGRTGFEPVTSSGSGKFRTVWVSVTVGLSRAGSLTRANIRGGSGWVRRRLMALALICALTASGSRSSKIVKGRGGVLLPVRSSLLTDWRTWVRISRCRGEYRGVSASLLGEWPGS